MHAFTHTHAHTHTNSNLTTLVVPDCMSGKKAGLTCGATGLGGAAIGNPTIYQQQKSIPNVLLTKHHNLLAGIGKSGLIIGGTGGGGYK